MPSRNTTGGGPLRATSQGRRVWRLVTTQTPRPRRTAVIAAVVPALVALALIGTGATPAQAAPADARTTAAQAAARAVARAAAHTAAQADAPERQPGTGLKAHASPTCPVPSPGRPTACLRPGTATAKPAGIQGTGSAPSRVSPDAVWPEWCNQVNGGIYATRTQACEVQSLVLTTYQETDDTVTVTGELNMAVVSYALATTTSPDWSHQLAVIGRGGWGDALGAVANGTAVGVGDCRADGTSFGIGPLDPPDNPRMGEADFSSTATAAGAVGTCTTNWTLLLQVPAYSPASADFQMTPIRCDNAVPNSGPGCVVPGYVSALTFDSGAYPTLAAHVAQAQASGLPGATVDTPLIRTTDPNIIKTNRSLACGDAPSIAGRSCDEYPMASTVQGLAGGGSRRTFDGCSFDNLPRATGPSGVSVCMINARDNLAQGGLAVQFYRQQRVLNGDPFRVLVA